METTEIVKVKQKYQIVLPVGLRKRISCKIGDLLEARIKGDHILLTPVKTIPKEQAWFWTKEWQEKEKESQADYDAGRIKKFNNAENAIKYLHKAIRK